MLTGLISGLILLSETVRSCRPLVLLSLNPEIKIGMGQECKTMRILYINLSFLLISFCNFHSIGSNYTILTYIILHHPHPYNHPHPYTHPHPHYILIILIIELVVILGKVVPWD